MDFNDMWEIAKWFFSRKQATNGTDQVDKLPGLAPVPAMLGHGSLWLLPHSLTALLSTTASHLNYSVPSFRLLGSGASFP